MTKSHQSQKSKSKSRAKNDVLAAQQDLGIDARTLRELAVKRLERDVKVDEEVVEIRRRVSTFFLGRGLGASADGD